MLGTHISVKHNIRGRLLAQAASGSNLSPMTAKGIPNRLRELRRARGLTQIELAQRAATLEGRNREEFSQSYISRMEAGSQNPTMRTWFAFAQALQCSPADLLSDQHNPGRLHGEEEHQLVALYREMDDRARNQLLSRAIGILRAQRGEITEAEMNRDLLDMRSSPPRARHRAARRTYTTPASTEDAE